MYSSTINTNFFIIYTSYIFIFTAIHILMYIIYVLIVDRYWKKIESIENSMQISSILLKLKGYDKK